MELKKEIRILGRRFEVEPRAKESLKRHHGWRETLIPFL